MFDSLIPLGIDGSLLLGAALVATAIPVLWWAMSGGDKKQASRHLQSSTTVDLHQLLLTRSAEERVVGPMAASVARKVRRLSPAGMMANLDRKVALAGSPATWPVERVLTTKLLLGLVSIALALVTLMNGLTKTNIIVAGVVVLFGYQAPDMLLSRTAAGRQDLIRRSLADAIDQVTISVEAGLGFDGAIARYAETGSGPLAEELMRVLQDIQLGLARKEAFEALLARTDIADLRQFVQALRQADVHGIPLAQVLRTQAIELRERRRQRAEAKAAAIPVKVIFPMIVCILPTLFIVILGPAVFRIADTFGG
ncbi:MAG: type II secretion system F family protein [Actinomycetia bacterium]|nr:type II secretion system F family protein [Actinomycetes bacterium]MCP4961791.1 type II secretion system F family protein [Actinomycetes bacterium]